MAAIPIAQLAITADAAIVMVSMAPSEIVRIGKIVTVWNILLIGGAALTAIATLFSIRYNDKLQSLKDTELSRFQSAAQRDISQANERAATANATAKTAEESAATAQLKQKQIEQKNIELATNLEKEHQERLKLETKIAPRRLSARQTRDLTQSLSVFRGSSIRLTRLGDQEAHQFAGDIIDTLHHAGWLTVIDEVGVMGPPVYGIAVYVPERLQQHPAILGLVAALRHSGIDVAVTPTPSQEVELIVGLKPIPPP